MNHQFYTQAPEIGPVYTLQYFCMDNAYLDETIQTDNVMGKIKDITNGESFYYQFDNGDNTSHCLTAHFDGDSLVIEKDEHRTTLPGSDLLTVILPE